MSARRPILSLILCSRNDAYLGNSRWRLETTLNYIGERIRALGRQQDVEIIVADWGSKVPLSQVVALRPAAVEVVSFLWVPPTLAQTLQRESPFPEVLALNAAARRARGAFIGRIDQDTLVGERFLRWLFAAVARGAPADGTAAPIQSTLLFANRRSIPYRLTVLSPRLPVIELFVRCFSNRLRVETGRVFCNIDVGIWLLHRDLWHECGGYDERMIYMNDMEIDMVTRLLSKYPVVDLGKIVGFDFYHLDHYHPRGSRSSATHRHVNGQHPLPSLGFRPSGDAWGLAAHALELSTRTPEPGGPPRGARGCSPLDVLVFVAMVSYVGMRLVFDWLIYPFYPVWKRRAAIAWATVRGESVARWPWLLRKIWLERPSARAR